MPTEPIEVEVVAIDDVAPSRPAPEHSEPQSSPNPQQAAWQKFQGRIRTLDRRWWPLWSLLGFLIVCLVLTVGVVAGVVFLVAKLIGGILGSIGRLFGGPQSSHLVRR